MMRKTVVMLGLGIALTAWSPGHAAQASPSLVATPCQVPPGWDQVDAKVVVFGEMHGTREAPAFVGNLACALAARGERVLVAVEHDVINDDDFQKAWAMPEGSFVAALAKTGWAERNDGVGSEAMLAMLVGLHRWAQMGRKIDIAAFNGSKDEAQARRFAQLPGQGPHDAAQAENIRVAAARQPYDHILVLTGNTHARKRPVTYTRIAFEPMAMRLARSVPVIALNMKSSGGTSWTCELKPGVVPKPNVPITDADVECAAHPLGKDADLDRAPFIALGSLPGQQPDPDYDGIFWLGPVTASPPAVPAQSPKRNP
ncbi:hypothetical protein [Sphingomonas sp. CFBP8993]|uniref:hypothetical protein n=1 Tax=Sphingomonas sp. CFBP8993 TaxID=3096526 RepID=UPI002A69EAA4|nr:hypothetical protein [Sphingomonas sp. CFBP8993]